MSCNTGESVNLGTRTATITMTAGENVTCTFTNTQQTGSIKVSKITYDAAGNVANAGTFTFLDGQTVLSPTVAGGGNATYPGLALGNHTITEQAQGGWTNLGGKLKGQGACPTTYPPASVNSSVVASVTYNQTTEICWYNKIPSAPALTITKSPDEQTVVSGGTATFTIVVTNTGNVPLTGVTVADALAPLCNKPAFSLAIGANSTYQCTLANVTQSFTNTAIADSNETDPVSDTAHVTVLNPGITLTKTNNTQNNTVAAGGNFNWTIGITVTDGPVSGVVSDTLPAGMTTLNGAKTDSEVGTALSCSSASNVVTCNLTNLGNGSYTVTIPVTAPAALPSSNCKLYTNTATVTQGPGQGNTDSNGVTVTGCTTTGTVIVEKVMVGGTGTFSFTGTPNGPISSNNGTISQSVSAGQYTSVEGTPPANWALTGIDCSDTDSTGSVQTSTATFNVAPGETVTCTFTNTYTPPGSITIVKDAVPNHAQDFMFDFNDDDTFWLDDDSDPTLSNTKTYTNLQPGTYYIEESAVSGWNLTNVNCNADKWSSEGGSVELYLGQGEAVTCTFTNTQQLGSLKITKITYNASGSVVSTGTFSFLDGQSTLGTVNGGGSNTFGNLTPGSHTVTEQNPGSAWTNLGGITLDSLDASVCPTQKPAPLSQSVAANVVSQTVTEICWYNQQVATPTPTPTPTVCVNCGVATPPPTPQVLGSSAQITKVRSSADPARVGERVNFSVTLTITGDTTVTGVVLTDTFENAYLAYVSSTPAGCTVTPNVPDAAHSQISCPIGDVTPGTTGNAGTKSFAYQFAFDALAPTPAKTINSVVAKADLDGTGPATPATIGPATADVSIVALPVALPKAGDGSMSLLAATPLRWNLLALVALAVGVAIAGASGLNRREQ